MAVPPPTGAGLSDQLPDSHAPSRSDKSASATTPDLAATHEVGERADGPLELSKSLSL